MSVSLSLIPYAAKAQGFINELLKKREQTQSQILQRTENAVTTHNLSLERYKTLKTGQDLLFSQLDNILRDILAAESDQDLKPRSNGPNLQWVMQTYVQNKVTTHATIARYRIARAQIQRALLEKYYTRYQMKESTSLLPPF